MAGSVSVVSGVVVVGSALTGAAAGLLAGGLVVSWVGTDIRTCMDSGQSKTKRRKSGGHGGVPLLE